MSRAPPFKVYILQREKSWLNHYNGKVLLIEGGVHRLNGFGEGCGRGSCNKHKHGKRYTVQKRL